jgi:hypothetical protein
MVDFVRALSFDFMGGGGGGGGGGGVFARRGPGAARGFATLIRIGNIFCLRTRVN